MLGVISKCAGCGYPLAANHVGQRATCPMCNTINEAISSVAIPDPIFWGGISIFAFWLLSKSKWVKQQLSKA